MSPRGAERKAAIVAAAIARLVRLGVEGLRVRDVADDVGINNATLHHHFPTKAALIQAVVERFIAGFRADGGMPEDGPIETRLAAYVALRQAQMRAAPQMAIVLNELMVLARRDAEVRRLMGAMQAGWQAYLADICRAAGEDPDTAEASAARCRREILGSGLELGVDAPPPSSARTSGLPDVRKPSAQVEQGRLVMGEEPVPDLIRGCDDESRGG